MREILAVAILSMSLYSVMGCKTSGDAAISEVKIVGGEPAPRSIHPWAYQISYARDPLNRCTGTFVSHNVMITAAHCIDEDRGVYLSELGNVRALSLHPYPPGVLGTVWIRSPNDVGIIVFPDNTASHYTSLAPRPPRVGENVTLLGYGSCEEFLGPREGWGRCYGSNSVSALEEDSRIVTREGGVTLSKGDSGGPLFISNLVAGVANGVVEANTGNPKYYHTNLHLEENWNWLTSIALEKGLTICGLSGSACGSTGNDDGSTDRAPIEQDDIDPAEVEDNVVKATRLATEFANQLAEMSDNCRFRVSGSPEFLADGLRFRIIISYALGTTFDEIRLNVALAEYQHGREIVEKLVRIGRLESSFSECRFNR